MCDRCVDGNRRGDGSATEGEMCMNVNATSSRTRGRGSRADRTHQFVILCACFCIRCGVLESILWACVWVRAPPTSLRPWRLATLRQPAPLLAVLLRSTPPSRLRLLSLTPTAPQRDTQEYRDTRMHCTSAASHLHPLYPRTPASPRTKIPSTKRAK